MVSPPIQTALLDHYTELVSYVLYLGRNPFRVGDADGVAAIFEQLLARSRRRATDNGVADSRWRDGLYPVVAWIDEQLLHMEWPGKKEWVGRSLQRRLFQTTLAGRDFFIRLEKLADEDGELREVYDMCLALGFKGQYFQSEDSDRLVAIMNDNLGTNHQDLPLRLPEVLFPIADSQVVGGGARASRLFNPWGQAVLWLLPIALVLGLYFWLRGSLHYPG